MDCVEKKCFRENILVYSEKTWLNILRNSYHTCTSKPKGIEKVLFKGLKSPNPMQGSNSDPNQNFLETDTKDKDLTTSEPETESLLTRFGKIIFGKFKSKKSKGLHFPN